MVDSSQPPLRDVVAVARESVRPAPSRVRRAASVARVVIPLALLSYLFTRVSLSQLLTAMRSVSVATLCWVALAMVSATSIASVRWGLTMRACGVTKPAPFRQLFRLFWIGIFYNAFVPGGLGGDVVRAVATRPLFSARGVSGALAVVVLDRVLGLIGLLLLVVGSFTLFPLPAVPNVMFFSFLGLLAAFGAIAGLMLAPRLAPHLPGPLGRIAASLPVVERRWPLLLGVLLSVLTQASGVVVGHLVLSSITTQATVTESAVIMPLVLASQYFPLTVGGTGVREAAFVALYGLAGVAQHDALAASLVVGMVQYAAGLPGGVLQMFWPLRVDAAELAEQPGQPAQPV